MKHDSVNATFLVEASELVTQIEEAILDLEQQPVVGEALNGLFRAFHTLKGAAGVVGHTTLVSFSHEVESMLTRVRNGDLEISRELIDAVLASTDFCRQLVAESAGGPGADLTLRSQLLARLGKLNPDRVTLSPSSCIASAPMFFSEPPPAAAQSTTYRIHFRPDPTILETFDPAALFDELHTLGGCSIQAQLDDIPVLGSLDPSRCYMRWDIRLTTVRDADQVRDVFAFVENNASLSIEVDAATAPNAPAPLDASDDVPSVSIQPILSNGPELAATATPHTHARRSGPNLASPVGASTAEPTASPVKSAAEPAATVRVAAEKLDRLVKLVGELVINHARLDQVARELGRPEVTDPIESLERLVGELRDNVLGIRMMPIGSTFSRFRRLVRDLASELGKEVDLVIEGEETELDKTVLDRLSEPMVHLIRNSLDHGIEAPEVRMAKGKSSRGQLTLSAVQQGATVVVTIQDNGAGLSVSAIRAKAIERGLISADALLSEAQIHDLIFAPGFSTAAAVSAVSGRGVGMDVVKRNVEALNGSVTIETSPDQGSAFRLALPLTLAIIDGLLVEVGGERLIIPLDAVSENVELSASARSLQNGRNAIVVRGEMIPYLDLSRELGFPSPVQELQRVVIVSYGRNRLGLLVDRVMGINQTVIQPMNFVTGQIKLVSGSTIIGDGRVALILDLPELLRIATTQPRQHAA